MASYLVFVEVMRGWERLSTSCAIHNPGTFESLIWDSLHWNKPKNGDGDLGQKTWWFGDFGLKKLVIWWSKGGEGLVPPPNHHVWGYFQTKQEHKSLKTLASTSTKYF